MLLRHTQRLHTSTVAIDVSAIAKRCYRDYKKVFTLEYFLREYKRYASRELSLRIKGKGGSRSSRPIFGQHQFAKLLLLSVHVRNAKNFFAIATAFLKL